MEHNVVVTRVGVVLMRDPIACTYMKLNVADAVLSLHKHEYGIAHIWSGWPTRTPREDKLARSTMYKR
ncbi:MAG: hypothetical protein NVS4B11_28070 [Ktedonobacteraceae bacterium]